MRRYNIEDKEKDGNNPNTSIISNDQNIINPLSPDDNGAVNTTATNLEQMRSESKEVSID